MIISDGMCHPDEDCPVNDFAHTHDLPEAYTRGFGILKDEIDPAAPHDMASIRANITKLRKGFCNRIRQFADTFSVSHIRVCEPRMINRSPNRDSACAHAVRSVKTQEQIDSDFASVMAYEPA